MRFAMLISALILSSNAAFAFNKDCYDSWLVIDTNNLNDKAAMNFAVATFSNKKTVTPPDIKGFTRTPIGDLVSMLRRSCLPGTVVRLPSDEWDIIGEACDFSKTIYVPPLMAREAPGRQVVLCVLRKADEPEVVTHGLELPADHIDSAPSTPR